MARNEIEIMQKLKKEKIEIETITNSNGTAIKFSDGIMICTKVMDLGNINYSRAYGSIYTTDLNINTIWNFPKQFVSTDDLVVNATIDLSGGIGGTAQLRTILK